MWLPKGNTEDPGGDGNVLCLDCISVKILVVTLNYSFARCYHGRKLGKGFKRSLCILSYNCI